MSEDLRDLSKKIIEIRRHLHRIPEIGFNEFKTSKFINDYLNELGYETEIVAKTGVIGYKRGNSNKGAIAFRSDIDGLEVTEKTGSSFASEVEGMMHACGHDGHMSILLGLAIYLSNYEQLERDVVLIFQPAEEGPGGAEVIIREGVFKKYNIEKIFGLHILPDIEEGKVGFKSGALMAATGEFDIVIKAKGGHGAMPHTAIDGIYVASQLISNYQSIVSRNIEPIEGGVVTIGKIKGGEARNIIAEKVNMEGTIRAFNPSVYNLIKTRINEINKGLEKMYNIEIDTNIRDMYPAVINDTELCEMFRSILDEDEIINMKPMMISEDFSFYQQEVPGLFFMLGARNEELGYIHPLHNNCFDFNEAILINGVKKYIKICNQLEVIL
ncbi:M20 metallopeptidase family protein [Sporosalibacterium faouarense]|uniref:M20 metallopeptidase family protein n=1 Tax=Sporosalibacterium faouarense TaxID=516123 RepID=UPI00141CBC08|nr:M20 family metallopeptidase [Sporosalibacterium faouarense]MTI49537.1 amidohydrolase [Bacillota bacterium]